MLYGFVENKWAYPGIGYAFFVVGRSMSKSAGMAEKHYKAIKMLVEAESSTEQIAKSCGISTDYLYDLIEGSPKAAPLSYLFKSELQKQLSQSHKDLHKLTKECKKIAIELLKDRVIEIKKLKKRPTKELVSIVNALNKATPNVEIGQFNQFNQMTPQELSVEYRRLISLGTGKVVGRAIPDSPKGTPRTLSDALSARHRLIEESEDSDV